MSRRAVASFLAVAATCALFAVDHESPLRGAVRILDLLCTFREAHELTLDGIEGEIRIRRDPTAGTVWVEAATESDMLYGQGYAQAKDRLFQLEILRRMSKGEIAEIIGEKGVGVDKWNRALRFRHLAAADVATMARAKPEVLALTESFVAGINAYIDQKTEFWNTVPIDLWLLRTIPARFTVADVLCFMRWHASAMNKGWQNELVFDSLRDALPEDVLASLVQGLRYTSGKDGLDAAYETMSSTLDEVGEVNPLPGLKTGSDGDGPSEMLAGLSDNGGSNAWVVSGEHTASGMPLLANDPHLPMSLPAAWHGVHLRAEKQNLTLTGLSVPLLPYVVAGNNGYIANGVTLSRCDADDVFVEKVQRPKEGAATYTDTDGQTKPLTLRTELIRVKGKADPIEFTVEETPRGPLVCGLLDRVQSVAEGELDCALRTLATTDGEEMWREFGAAGVAGLRTLAHARDFDGFLQALSETAIAQLNMVFADTAGNIGYSMTGRVPTRMELGQRPRHGWNASHAWTGWHPHSAMPRTLNPKRGFVVSANQKPYPGPHDEPAGFGDIFQHGWRSARLEALIAGKIAAGEKVTAADSIGWQRDLVSLPAVEFVKLVREVLPESEDGSEAAALIRAWDGRFTVESSAAAVFAAAREAILRRVLTAAFPPAEDEGACGGGDACPAESTEAERLRVALLVDRILGVGELRAGKLSNDFEGRSSALLLRLLHAQPSVAPLLRGLPPARALLADGLAAAAARLLAATGAGTLAGVRWGDVHPASFGHPLGKAGFPLDHVFNVDAGGVPGDSDTVQLAAFLHQQEPIAGLPLPPTAKPFAQRGFAATGRLIVDMADVPGTMRLIVAPGNSGRISSPHYRDTHRLLTGGWEEHVPLVGGVEGTELEETLLPA
eukprot:Rhum_TRINITY_DN14533_c3_g1::Rhum_TRINITY_DN14533_c3_g1_i1::g.99017::m.99017/K01434/E3.5.1.11; penicillin amidase